VSLGVPLGLAMGRFRAAEQFTDVYVNILLVTPIAALIPLLLMSLGFTLTSRVVLVTLFALPMVVVNTRVGVRQVDSSLLPTARGSDSPLSRSRLSARSSPDVPAPKTSKRCTTSTSPSRTTNS